MPTLASAPYKPMHDADVRAAVLTKVLKKHGQEANTLVIEELGIEHGRHRVDIAVVNGVMHGYEIKSESDNLSRLPAQAAAYSRTFDCVTLVVDATHCNDALQIIPKWWGVKMVRHGAFGAINIKTHRAEKPNPEVCLFTMSHLLWKDEAIAVLRSLNVAPKLLRGSREDLYRCLVELVAPDQLKDIVRNRLRTRVNWRTKDEKAH
jgi:hypothetical protein